MNLRRDRILDRLWLALSGAAALSVALQWGTQLGLRPWFSGAAVLAAQAAAPDGFAQTARQAAGCRGERPGKPR